MEKKFLSPFFGLKNNYYLFEKGSGDEIYSVESFKMPEKDDFIKFLNNFPINFSNESVSDLRFKYVTLESVYKNRKYGAIFFRILDSLEFKERTLIYAQICEDNEVSINKNALKFAETLFNDNLQQFEKEVVTKAKTLKNISEENKKMMNEILEKLQINIEDEKMLIDERFLMSQNRKAIELFNIKEISQLFYELAYYSDYLNENIAFPQSWKPKTDFGLANSSLTHFLSAAALQEGKSLYIKFAQCHAFAHVLKNLLSARPFVIVTKETEKFIPLVVKLSSFIPSFDIDGFVVKDTIRPEEMKNGMIGICKNLDGEDCSNLAILSIDEEIFEGLLCEEESFVSKLAEMDPTQSAQSFIMSSYALIRREFDEIDSIFASITNSDNICVYQIESCLKNAGKSKCDLRIYAVWAKMLGFEEIYNIINERSDFMNVGSCFL